MQCHACGTALSAAARFCHKCGAQVGTAQAAGWRAGLPWAVAGGAVGALIAVVALKLGGPGDGRREGFDAAPPPASRLAAPDISQMSPEERATRLFNRVMRLSEERKPDSLQFFLPMALQAYAQLPALDVDARYHIGVLHLAGGDGIGALAQADTIRRAVPTHLFAFVLRARALEIQPDARGARQAYRDFLRHEPAERTRRRPEYDDHLPTLDAFHAEALRVMEGAEGGGPG